MAREQGEEGHVVSVTGQEGQRAMVAIPMVGFPEGFQLSTGARVVLVNTPSGPAVRPLAQASRGQVPSETVEQGGEVSVAGRRGVVQDATVVGEQPASSEDVVWLVETSDPESPDQVIAVRRAGRR